MRGTSERETPEWAFDGRRHRQYRFAPDIEQRIRELNVLDNWHGPLGWTRDLLLVIGSVLLCSGVSWWLYPLALVVIGSRQRAFSNLLHESAHNILTADRRLNLLLGTVLTAYPIFQLHYAYKRSHVAEHHPHLGNPDRDPDLRYFIERKVYQRQSKKRLWWSLVVLPLLGSSTWSYLRYLVRNRFGGQHADEPAGGSAGSAARGRRERRDRVVFALFWAVVVGASVAMGWWHLIILFWLIPYLTIFQILGWYIELSEHTPLVRDSNISLFMTRNRMSRGLELFLTGTYADHRHLDHHLDPRTPYWNLERARRIRLDDAQYATVDRSFSGLFHRGRQGQPCALADIVGSLARPAPPRKSE
ncbi:fatty acid desaturase [Streptomyces sp. NPDC014735]|uniref:fatty acid desaturase n=1 Tax=unclassified Streptomyces TaxID=2593676 RepID=UPI0036FBA8B5